MSENVFRIVVVILLSVITLLLLFGLGEGPLPSVILTHTGVPQGTPRVRDPDIPRCPYISRATLLAWSWGWGY